MLSQSHNAKCNNWPKISVITPSFNQGAFIEATIRSVIDQKYPNLEYIIVDGESTDGSVGIIRKYEGRLAYWVSEPDRGQSHALNKGFAKASGDILCWLNSDDYFEVGTLEKVALYFSEHLECQWLVGRCQIVDESGSPSGMYEPRWTSREKLLRFWETDGTLPQPASFWRYELMQGRGVRESLHYAMDFDLWLNFSRSTSPYILPNILANYRMQSDAKTVRVPEAFLEEILLLIRPEWKAQGGIFHARMEWAWRNNQADRCFNQAFSLKHAGNRSAAWSSLMQIVVYQPLKLVSWKVINLIVRLGFGL